MVLYYISFLMYIDFVAPRVSAFAGVWQLNISSEIFKKSWDETHEMATIFPVKYSSSHETRFGRKRVSTYSWRDRGINPMGFDTRLLTVRDDFNISNEIFR
jgi:hypothetical protein